MDQYFREPLSAAIISAGIVVAYIYLKTKLNNEKSLKNSDYFKPAFLVALLVFFVVNQGKGESRPAILEPF